MKFSILLLAVFMACARPCTGDVLHVPENYATINAAVNAAQRCDTILISGGTYLEHDITIIRGICIIGDTTSIDGVTIDANNLGRAFKCYSGNDSLYISNITFLNGNVENVDWPTSGGAIYFYGNYCQIKNCTFNTNRARSGGAINDDRCYDYSKLQISDCVFANNIAFNGYGGSAYFSSNVLLEDCIFNNNWAYLGGGAVYYNIYADSNWIDGCTFENNSAESGGGAIYGSENTVHNTNMTTISFCQFVNNHTEKNGGAIQLDRGGAYNVINCTFDSNKADSGAGGAAYFALYGPTGSKHVISCSFQGNSAKSGGGIYCGSPNGLNLADCDFSADSARSYGGGAYVFENKDVTFYNCSFVGCVASLGGGLACNFFAHTVIDSCLFADDSASQGGAVFTDGTSSYNITGTEISNNKAYQGGGIYCGSSQYDIPQSPSIRNSVISNNVGTLGGGGIYCSGFSTIDSCLIIGNSSSGAGGGVYVRYISAYAPIVFRNITFSHNGSTTTGAHIYTYSSYPPITLQNSILAFSLGSGPTKINNLTTIECSNIYGNTGGDWLGNLSSYKSINGNLSMDPEFCDWVSNDYHLRDVSPCAPENNSCNELIGAMGVECPATSVTDDDLSVSIPNSYELLQNYPNPFNPETTIEYILAKRSHVTLDVYNLLGQKIRSLVEREESAGSYTVAWDGADASGKPLATGVYFYRFQAGDQIEMKKMVLLK